MVSSTVVETSIVLKSAYLLQMFLAVAVLRSRMMSGGLQ
jgi:hypothetical protein